MIFKNGRQRALRTVQAQRYDGKGHVATVTVTAFLDDDQEENMKLYLQAIADKLMDHAKEAEVPA